MAVANLDHYQAEQQAFEASIAEFVRAHPEKSYLLEAIKGKTKDPYVERLFSGVAYLIAGLKTDLDHNNDSIAEAILDQHWPDVLQPYPAMMMVTANLVSQVQSAEIPKGTVLLTTPPLGPEKTQCQFTTLQDEVILPIVLNETYWDEDDHTVMALDFSILEGADLSKVDALKLSFCGELYAALALYGDFLLPESQIELWIEGQLVWAPLTLQSTNTELQGFRPLLDFVAFPDKFLAVHVLGLKGILTSGLKAFQLKLRGILVGRLKDCIKINCFPVINLYRKPAEPLRLTPSQLQYPIVADIQRPNSVHALAVDTIFCTKTRRSIPFMIQRKQRVEKPDQLMAQFSSDTLLEAVDANLTVAQDIWVCNDKVPAQYLRPQQHFFTKMASNDYRITVESRPTKLTRAFAVDSHYLMLMGILKFHMGSLFDIDCLKSTLSYLIGTVHQRTIDCLQSLSIQYLDYMEKGVMKTRCECTLTIASEQFVNAGERLLWCQLITQLLTAYAPVNQTLRVTFDES